MIFLCGDTSAQQRTQNKKAIDQPAHDTGIYRNLFLESGYNQADIDKKVAKAYRDLFEGPNRIYFEVGDSMAYVSDIKNNDARTEGLSYGMMVAVQLDKKEVFDRIWRWSKKYLQHQNGPREGYFAWSINPHTMKKNSEGSASDGELYYITSLLFAANKWGNNTGINYYQEARRILDCMWKKDGTGNIYNLINTEHKQITFVPEGDNYNWTDPSYHLPAFYEVWALYAKDGHEQFYLDCADTSRVFLHRTTHPKTGLNPDYAEFSGAPHSTPWMPAAFRYDSWRVPMNIAMDYSWFGKDKAWQENYGKRFQSFLRSRGMDTFEDQFNMDGTRPDFILQAGTVKKLRHSLGLISTAATASTMNKEKNSRDFIDKLWNAKLEPYEDGYFDPYYDGLLYMFSLMHASGKYQIIKPTTTASSFSLTASAQATNPIILADVPDISIIRVGDTYYMSSTTMHMSPGLPIMSSKDLVNWKLVSYAYDTLVDNDEMNLSNGKSTYGRGSWASSIRHHKGTYYVSTFAATSGKTHIYITKNIEKGPWKELSFSPALHDHSLFFDDDGKVFMIYGNKELKLVELKDDLTGIKDGGINQVIIKDSTQPSQSAGNSGLGEGSQLFKYKGKYYLFNITWPQGGMRTVVIHRADRITGPWEGRVALADLGVAQGGLIDKPDGSWFAYLFRDYGALGRIPYLVPVTWEDGWPVLGLNGKVPETLSLPSNKSLIPGIVASDEFTRKKGDATLPLVWQWNHNPDDRFWSLQERPGYLRITTNRTDTNFLMARNTLTQRTIGPGSTGSTSLDLSQMKDGDFAGLGLLQKNYGLVGVKVDGERKTIIMINAGTGKPVEVQSLPIRQNIVFFKATCDFTEKKDVAHFFYSLDGKTWKPLGNQLKMSYTLPHFMGYRFALFNYATKQIGGYADFDYFHISAKSLN